MAGEATRLGAEEVIRQLQLAPLEGEGGFFHQTWVSLARSGCPHPRGTVVLYLITPEKWSALHRLRFDEDFHFYLGDSCEMVVAREGEGLRRVRLGPDLRAAEPVQHVVPAGWWQGTQLAPGGEWALLGITMAPRFRPEAFVLATPSVLEEFSAGDRERLLPYLP
ncbi:MAG TPA: cupin domain-containing protein [Thermomicrobiales bacterium]|nr:cupin domain-containing protein [Thermomicrobiales bacterium]